MYIRKAKETDIDQITAVEAACFPPAEAASRDRLADRIAVYPDCFWLGFDDYHELICYAAGPLTAESDLTDEMYADTSFHRADGDWQMIFSLCTLPDRQRQGLGAWVFQRVIAEAYRKGRKGIVLTCKKDKIPFYETFGFVNEGLSDSEHGNAEWYQMRLTFDEDYFYEQLFFVSDDPKVNRKMLEDSFWNAPM